MRSSSSASSSRSQAIRVVGRVRTRRGQRGGGPVSRGIPCHHAPEVGQPGELTAPGLRARADPVQQHQRGAGADRKEAEPDIADLQPAANRLRAHVGRRAQFSTKPPLTGSTWPVMKPADSLSRNTTAPTTSSGYCARAIARPVS